VCLGLLGVVAVRQLPLKAQQPALPVIGFLSSGSPRAFAKFLKAFQQGLSEVGFVEGRNVSIVYRWAEGHFDELDALAAELAANPVVLIAATGGMRSAQAAKKATETIPIVTVLGFDPVKLGLVASFNKPGGNLTGTSIITTELAPKRLSLLYHLDPDMQNVAILMNPASTSADVEAENLVVAAQTADRPLVVLKAGLEKEIDAAFASATQRGVRGVLISADPLFTARRNQLVALAASYKLPVMYPFREFVEAGRFDELWAKPRNGVSCSRHLRWSHSQGHEAERPADRRADDIRVSNQPQNSQGAWANNPVGLACDRRRDDRVTLLFPAFFHLIRDQLLRLLIARIVLPRVAPSNKAVSVEGNPNPLGGRHRPY
jgi:putative ABC transport system substrate-binding protein